MILGRFFRRSVPTRNFAPLLGNPRGRDAWRVGVCGGRTWENGGGEWLDAVGEVRKTLRKERTLVDLEIFLVWKTGGLRDPGLFAHFPPPPPSLPPLALASQRTRPPSPRHTGGTARRRLASAGSTASPLPPPPRGGLPHRRTTARRGDGLPHLHGRADALLAQGEGGWGRGNRGRGARPPASSLLSHVPS